MAYVAPNNLIGEFTVNVALSSTSATSLRSNAASSGRVFKVIAIVAANVDGTNAADISVSRYSAAALGGTALLGEPLPLAALLGLACVLAGLWWALKPGQRVG